jgi:glyoxylase-like metal-dependent hydrolase (beta-lactamase superfamily II)
MTATFDVLVPGYVRDGADGHQHVCGTVSLIRSGGVVIVADPGMMTTPTLLRDSLREHGLGVADVTHVFVSHHHLDHTRNIGMFPIAAVVDADSIYCGDVWDEHVGSGYHLAPDVSILSTPGHATECASLVVATADQGVVVYTHAWWHSDMTPEIDPLAFSQDELERSRARILAIADVIVPGHGEPFRTGATR